MYWHEHCKGPLQLIANREIDAGHFTRIGRRDTYKVHGHDDWRRNLAMELSANFELEKACESMGLSELWRSVKARLAESDVKLANAASSV